MSGRVEMDEFVQRYLAGESMRQIARSGGPPIWKLSDELKARGIESRGRGAERIRVFEPGERYGRLTVVERRDQAGAPVHCRCDCGTEVVVKHAASLPSGNTKSCGCLHTENTGSGNPNWRGGRTSHPLYDVWHDMIARCYRPTHKRWKDYGGRGITVCDRWRNDFWAYVQDMGSRPFPRATVDRIDNNAGYSPENCRWATYSQQAINRRPFQTYHDAAGRFTTKESAA